LVGPRHGPPNEPVVLLVHGVALVHSLRVEQRLAVEQVHVAVGGREASCRVRDVGSEVGVEVRGRVEAVLGVDEGGGGGDRRAGVRRHSQRSGVRVHDHGRGVDGRVEEVELLVCRHDGLR